MLKVGKILDICIQRCLWDGGRVTAWACVIWKKRHKWKVFPRHVHDCREDHTHLISDLWPGSVTEDTQDESTGLRVTEWNWMELFWSDNSTCVKTRKITFMMDSLSLFYFLPLEQTSTVVHDINLLKNLKSRVFSDFVNETISF